METTLDRLDFLVLAVYLVSVVGLGSYFARGVKTSDDFFLAGRSFGWFPLGLSIVVSLLSANGYLTRISHRQSTTSPQSSALAVFRSVGLLDVLHEYDCGGLGRKPCQPGACDASLRPAMRNAG